MLFRSLTGFIVTLSLAGSALAQVPPNFDPARTARGPLGILTKPATPASESAARLGRPQAQPEPTALINRAARLIRPIAHTSDEPTAIKPPSIMVPKGLEHTIPCAADMGYGKGCPGECEQACYPDSCGWVRGEWLYWTTTGQQLPALVTTAPVGTPRAAAGTLNNPSTTILYGNQSANNDWRNGFRLTAGFYFGAERRLGIEGDFFFLGSSQDGFAAASGGSPILSRPFFNTQSGLPDVELVAFPDVLAGTVRVNTSSNIIGGGANGTLALCCDPCGRCDFVFGYRYFNLTDQVTIREDLTALSGQSRVPAGFQYHIQDKFRTSNNFHGGVLGVSCERTLGKWFVNGRATVALGANHQVTEISGYTTAVPPGGPAVTYAGGLLTQPSNIGTYTRNTFAVMPEVGLRLGYNVTERLRVYGGYNFLYLSNVARAGEQIDVRVNPTLLPPRTGVAGGAFPTFAPRTNDFWVYGISAGLQFTF